MAACCAGPKRSCWPSGRVLVKAAIHQPPAERVDGEIGRRSDVVGIYPNDAALIRLAGALLVEHNEWLVPSLSAESLGAVLERPAQTARTREVSALPGGLRPPPCR